MDILLGYKKGKSALKWPNNRIPAESNWMFKDKMCNLLKAVFIR